MNMTQADKKQIVERLVQFKQDYKFTSKEIAKTLGTTEAAVSHWFQGDTLPRPEKINSICQLFDKYCIPGIIKIPQNKHWNAWIFIQVDDIKNPYGSWHTSNIFGETAEQMTLWIEDWKQEFPNPEIYRQYEAGAHGRALAFLECMNLNTTIEFKDYFIGQSDLQKACSGINPQCLDYALVNALMRGDVDGTT